jgi:hypothetical protein
MLRRGHISTYFHFDSRGRDTVVAAARLATFSWPSGEFFADLAMRHGYGGRYSQQDKTDKA